MTNPAVVGQWTAVVIGHPACSKFVRFADDGTFDLGAACYDPPGTRIEHHRGTYTTAARTLTAIQTRSTCPGDVKEPLVFEFRIVPDRLPLTTEIMTTDYFRDRSPITTLGNAAPIGCFDASYGFEPMGEHDLY